MLSLINKSHVNAPYQLKILKEEESLPYIPTAAAEHQLSITVATTPPSSVCKIDKNSQTQLTLMKTHDQWRDCYRPPSMSKLIRCTKLPQKKELLIYTTIIITAALLL